ATVIHGNAFVEGPKIVAKLLEEKKRGWFYLDPPFAIRDGMADIYERTQRLIASLDPEAVIKIVVEHDAKVVFPDEIGPYKLLKTRRFGASALSWYAIAE
ncbi:MAG: 16S rRNA (guanine(966)-N(2))-methyltransferase RsmD, partial [Campylobacterales bacterium]